MKFGRAFSCCAALTLLAASIASARPIVKLHFGGDVIRLVDGHVKLTPVQSAGILKRGDRVRYTIDATNDGDSGAVDLITVGPIPKRTAFVPGSAHEIPGTAVEYSLDGKTWSVKPTIVIRTGKIAKRKPADPSTFVSVRWLAKRTLMPKATFHYAYEVVVK